MNPAEFLFTLFRAALSKNPVLPSPAEPLTAEERALLYALSATHDLAHLAGYALSENGLLGTDAASAYFRQSIMMAAYRCEQLSYELEQLCGALEQAKIRHIPLKGSVLRPCYPEPWMRTSCDIDVLVHEEDLKHAVKVLEENCRYTVDFHKTSHDISLHTPAKIHIELHYDLLEDNISKKAAAVLKSVWSSAVPRSGYSYCCDMPDELFYFYHIAHMAKHYLCGGCGIRPFMDLRILDRMENTDAAKRDDLLARGRLLQFAECARRLSRVWFDGAEMDDFSEKMQDYILQGGTYGSPKNQVTVQRTKTDGTVNYILSRLFLPYDDIKHLYPILQKHPWLTPPMQVRRWFKLFLNGKLEKSLAETKVSRNLGEEEIDDIRKMLHHLGL